MNFYFKSKTLESYEKTNINCFDFLRWLSASVVILYHSFVLVKAPNAIEALSHKFFAPESANAAVLCFFVISGFLITASFIKKPYPLIFLKARCLRIFPALIVSVLFTALIIGAMFTTLPLKAYFSDPEVYKFIFHNTYVMLQAKYALPGVFENNPQPFAVNGSLWTIHIEFLLYLGVLVLGLCRVFNYKICAVILIGALLIFIDKHHFTPAVFSCISCFMIGAVFYLLKHRIILNIWMAVIFILLTLLWPSHWLGSHMIGFFTFAYLILCIAYLFPGTGKFITRWGDFSYGLYIFAFPLQQAIIYFMPHLHPWMLFGMAYPLTFCFAAFSWFYIEKPLLKLKQFNILFLRKSYGTG